MKKETFLHKLTNWLAALGFAAVCGCIAVVNKQVQKASAYTVQKAQESVIFSVNELTDCDYSYLTPTENQMINSRINYNGLIYTYYNYEQGLGHQWVNNSNDYYIEFNNGHFTSQTWEDTFNYPLTIYSEYFVNNIYKITTIGANQLNNDTFTYFYDKIQTDNDGSNFRYNYISYNNKLYLFDEFDGQQLAFLDTDGIEGIYLDENEKWGYSTGEQNIEFTNSITIYSTYIADNLYAPFTDGNDIIGGITSGLGLISYLATTFLNGFTGLFWQNNALTNFAMYSLIMLGIAITFSIIKLVLNILRSNTGA